MKKTDQFGAFLYFLFFLDCEHLCSTIIGRKDEEKKSARWRGGKRKKSKSKRKGFLHNDVVNGDVDQLHEESNKAH